MKIKTITKGFAYKYFPEQYKSRDFHTELTAEIQEGEDWEKASKELNEAAQKQVRDDIAEYIKQATTKQREIEQKDRGRSDAEDNANESYNEFLQDNNK